MLYQAQKSVLTSPFQDINHQSLFIPILLIMKDGCLLFVSLSYTSVAVIFHFFSCKTFVIAHVTRPSKVINFFGVVHVNLVGT